jgi:hypothetical protein
MFDKQKMREQLRRLRLAKFSRREDEEIYRP